MNREELIEEAADAMFTANDGQLGQGYDEMARAALAVFEQAHTPITPTDDEREALIEEATWVLIDWDTDIVDRGVRDEHYRERRADVERVFPILCRRPVQGEPKCLVEHPITGRLCSNPADSCRGHVCDLPPAVQGEPTSDEWRAGEQSVADAMHYVANPEPQGEPDALCEGWPAPCDCDDPDTHDGSVPKWLVEAERPAHGASTDEEWEALIDILVMTRMSDFAGTDVSVISAAATDILKKFTTRRPVQEGEGR